ncbi:MAG: hypothetical protein A3K19_04450 [Lentisphaerae bacterium RIFOXYB12_FULL_65_16]|nr:MAG: hypothetical protein A3K18_34920 [Lentisphaerae bacterium RIFOXYA12_64_32]OGV84571.1 MAG: hypothetical protein A3K19_04450 [Lentisphaerae bacterium RIFOXYB12_FULL_65_16]
MAMAASDIVDLRLPLSEAAARALPLGQMVTVSGRLFTGRSRFHMRAIEDGLVPPLDYGQVNAFFHAGPVVRNEGGVWHVVSAEPTSSIRFERYGADVVRRLGLRTLIGKTTMGPRTAAALRDVGGVYLSKIGITGNFLSQQIRRVCEVHFLEELGKTEATWVFEVERFGPFFVAMDANGGNYFEDLQCEVGQHLPGVYAQLGLGADWEYTCVSPKPELPVQRA